MNAIMSQCAANLLMSKIVSDVQLLATMVKSNIIMFIGPVGKSMTSVCLRALPRRIITNTRSTIGGRIDTLKMTTMMRDTIIGGKEDGTIRKSTLSPASRFSSQL